VVIKICDYSLPADDPSNLISPGNSICTSPLPRKLVYVGATTTVHLAFLPVIGINTATISSSATSEAASVDVALVIDRSESMTYVRPFGNPLRDPYFCNGQTSPEGNSGDCEPYNTIKNAAVYFVSKLYPGFDRVAIVTFDKHAHTNLPLTYDQSTVIGKLRDLSVYYADNTDNGDSFDAANVGNICWDGNPCRLYSGSNYITLGCPEMQGGGTLGNCGSTNIGEGLAVGVNQFISASAEGGERDDAVWVIILLTDGEPNAAYNSSTGDPFCPGGPDGPDGTPNYWWHSSPGCRPANDLPTDPRHNVSTDPTNYTPYDFALDEADYIHVSEKIFVFTIGEGPTVTGSDSAKALLKYIANQGRGSDYITPDANGLHKIFVDIANNIATKLAK
jgi:hypothetical protein